MRRLPWVAAVWLLWLSGCKGPDASLPPAYRNVAVPRGLLSSPEARQRGRALFEKSCALCHGVRADGKGVRREGLSESPADFTSRGWRKAHTPRGVFHAIREGVPDRGMPAWKAFSETQCWDLTAYVLSVAEQGS
jgi:mono/diheme cytochrome c family protein